jgi:phosphoglycerate dehydrogenase-like enzyme
MNLLVTGAFNCREADLQVLSDMGNEVLFQQMESEDLPCSYSWVEGVVCNGLFLHHPIEKFENLKYIQLTSAGFDRVDMEYIEKKGIKIFNARGVYSVPMAEFALWGVLELLKQGSAFTENQKAHKWEKIRGLKELFGKTVCVVGCGNVGSECAKRFKAFGTRVLGVDIVKPKSEFYDEYFPFEEMSEALGEADVLVLTLPLTKKTENLFDSKTFALLKKDALLVNISRGKVLNQQDLITALSDGKISGAVLDVFETEPLEENSPLWDMENVIITPHNSFVGENNLARLKEVILKNLEMLKSEC